MSTQGFLLTRQWRDTPAGIELTLWISTDRGPICLRVPKQESVFFIRTEDLEAAKARIAQVPGWRYRELELKNFHHEPISAFYFQQQKNARQANHLLVDVGIEPLEADIRPADRFLMERFVTAPLMMAYAVNEEYNFRRDPALSVSSLKPTEYHPQFKIISLDIETSFDGNDLYSIGLANDTVKIVWMIGGEEVRDDQSFIRWVKDERELMWAFINWVEEEDPDIFIGWNVVNFDFRFLDKKAKELRIPFNIGRKKSPVDWRTAHSNDNHYFLLIPGRIVLDGIDTLKTATFQMERYSLEFVSRELLGEGKKIDQVENRGEKIKDLFYEDKTALAEYNLQDCELVWRIFEKADLMNFAIERSRLTGLPMDRVGGSVASFENLYLAKMHRKGYVAPNLHSQTLDIAAPGGYVLNSRPGLYQNVLVFDFKSLYPSIIRTFKIDPVGMIEGLKYEEESGREDDETEISTTTIPGYNGGSFHRTETILPDIILELWQARDRAKKEKRDALSQAIKIIMNSFYGVLGSKGCRFYDPRLSSSITMRGHWIIQTTKQWIEESGFEVIYGDTDSVFVLVGESYSAAESLVLGNDLAQELNERWQKYLIDEFAIESALELEFETLFTKFFMPTIRGLEVGSKKRYAGMKWVRKPDAAAEEYTKELQFKGLETVRTDWTALAKHVQYELYGRVFNQEPYEEYLKSVVDDLMTGKLDESLIYKKRLRQGVGDYKKNIPPHAQAAILEEKYRAESGLKTKYRNGSWVEYYITKQGPEPVELFRSPIDYDHYLMKQLAPVVDSILQFSGNSLEQIINPQGQLF